MQYLKIIQGVLFILIAIRLNIISAEIYSILKHFKPHNIKYYV